MSSFERMTLAAGLAVALACAAFDPMFSSNGWIATVVGAVTAVTVAGLVSRRLGVTRPFQPLVAVAILAGYLIVVFASGTLAYNVLPTNRTWDALHQLLIAGNKDAQLYRAPIPTTQGLLLMTAAGAGLIAVIVDTLAVCLQRAGLAGLPLLALFAVPAAVVPGGIGGLAFVLAATGWLVMLAVEGHDTVNRWGTTLAQGGTAVESSAGRLGRRIGVSAVGVAVVIPLLIPGLDKTLIKGSGTGEGPGSSSSAQTYNPITRLRAQLTLPSAVQLFQYRTNDPEPEYIRLTTLDRYDGTGWSASPLTQRRNDARVQKGIRTPATETGPHQDLQMRVALDGGRLDVFWLPLPYGPTQVDVQGTWLWDPASQTAFSASRTTKGLPAYDVTASRVRPDREALARAQLGVVDPAVRNRYGNGLPVTTYVRELTAAITAQAGSPYARAAAIQSFFADQSNNFFYDLSPSLGRRGEDQLEAFLRGRRGFCEQYATAMAVMLRVAGIPSRVAVGFTQGSTLPGGTRDNQVFSVTTQDAHAWPEAWFEGTGWVRFEPTPAESGSTVPDYSVPATATPRPTPTPGGQTAQPTAAPTRNPALPGEDVSKPGGSEQEAGSATRWGRWAVLALALAVLVGLPAALTALRRRLRWRRPGPLTAWEQLQEDARDLGHAWQANESPRAGAARLAAARRLPDPARQALDRVALAAELARYARSRADQRADTLRHDVRTVRSAMQHGCARGVRLRAQLCPPSTVRWATEGAGDLIEATTERLEDSVAKVQQRLRHPAR